MPSCQSLILLAGCSMFRPTEKSTAMLLREGSQVDHVGIRTIRYGEVIKAYNITTGKPHGRHRRRWKGKI